MNGSPLPRLHSRKEPWLLALLALQQGAPIERRWLAGILWPDSTAGQTLRNCLSDLRRALGPEAARLRSPTRHTLCLDLTGADVDVAAFDQAIASGDPASLERAVGLYRGPLLEGCTEEWAFQERQVREQAYLGALEALAGSALTGEEPAAAERFLRRVLALDPLRESACRTLMQCQALQGNYAGVLQSYTELRLMLRRDLGIEPAAETRTLVRKLRAEARGKAVLGSGPRALCGKGEDRSSRVLIAGRLNPEPGARSPQRERSDPEGENRLVTALFAEIGGDVESSRDREPEDAADLLNRLLQVMAVAVEQYEGRIDRFQGNGVMAVFGVPRTCEEDPERAIRAALAIRHDARALGLEVSIGISTGEVYAGAIGPRENQEIRVIGPAVSLAARLQEQARPEEIWVSQATYRQTRRAFRFTHRELAVKGMEGPVSAYRLESERARPEKSRGIEGLRAELVGRDEELAKLQQALAAVKAGQGQMVALVGEAGVGKSRLVAELKAGLGPVEPGFGSDGTAAIRNLGPVPSHLWLEGRCLELEMTTSYGPFLDLLRDHLGWHPDDSEAQRAEKVVASLRALVIEGHLSDAVSEEIGPLLGYLLGLRLENESDESPRHIHPDQMREQILLALRGFFLGLARRQPVVLVLDDLHWADTLSLDLLTLLMETLAIAPLLLLCIYRPDPEHRSRHLGTLAARKCTGRYTEIYLRELPLDQSRRLVDLLLRTENLSSGVREKILARAGGNPFFLEEIVRSLIESGMVYRHGRARRARGEIETNLLPESVQSVLLSRIDRLEPELKHVLQQAAVIGRVFPRRILEEASEGDALATGLDQALWALEERALVYREQVVPETAFSFQHVLTQETVYRNIPRRRRAVIHAHVAEAIERLHGERLEPHFEQLAHHYQMAGVAEKAVEYHLHAGEKALHLYANEEAIQHLAAALQLMDGRPNDEMHLRLRSRIAEALARGYFNLQEKERAQSVYQDYLTLAETLGDPQATAEAHFRLGGKPFLRLEHLEKSVAICEKHKLTGLLIPARLALAFCIVQGRGSELGCAEALLRQMLDTPITLNRQEARDAYELLVEACARQGKWQEAAVAFRHCLTAGGPQVVVPSRCLSLMENTLDREGRRADFVAFCDEARSLLDEAGIQTSLNQWYLAPARPSDRFDELIFHDDFDSPELRAEWQWHDPIQCSRYSLSDRPGHLILYSRRESDLWPTNNLNAPRLLLEVRGDVALETRVEGTWDHFTGSTGLLIWKDVRNFLRFDKMGMSTWHYGDLSLEGRVNGEYLLFGRGRLPGETYYLRVERTSRRLAAFCSTDGTRWLTCGHVDFAVGEPLLMGVHSIGGLIGQFDYVRLLRSGGR